MELRTSPIGLPLLLNLAVSSITQLFWVNHLEEELSHRQKTIQVALRGYQRHRVLLTIKIAGSTPYDPGLNQTGSLL
jgi:hypothetical protein